MILPNRGPEQWEPVGGVNAAYQNQPLWRRVLKPSSGRVLPLRRSQRIICFLRDFLARREMGMQSLSGKSEVPITGIIAARGTAAQGAALTRPGLWII